MNFLVSEHLSIGIDLNTKTTLDLKLYEFRFGNWRKIFVSFTIPSDSRENESRIRRSVEYLDTQLFMLRLRRRLRVKKEALHTDASKPIQQFLHLISSHFFLTDFHLIRRFVNSTYVADSSSEPYR